MSISIGAKIINLRKFVKKSFECKKISEEKYSRSSLLKSSYGRRNFEIMS